MSRPSRPLPSAVARYYESLDAGDMERAASSFAADVLYEKPSSPGSQDAGRTVVRGRPALLDEFRRRGRQPFRHATVEWAQSDEGAILLDGAVAGLPGATHRRPFLAWMQLDGAGLVVRYQIAMVDGERVVQHDGHDAAAQLVDAVSHPPVRVVFAETVGDWVGVVVRSGLRTILAAGHAGAGSLAIRSAELAEPN